MADEDKVISSVYPEFYGSIKDTYDDAKKKDPSIKYDNVNEWFARISVRRFYQFITLSLLMNRMRNLEHIYFSSMI